MHAMSHDPRPTPALASATLMLLRQGARSPEILLMQRHARSHDFPALYVFPGGLVEHDDAVLENRLHGVETASITSTAPHIGTQRLQRFLVAAIRETFEEAGILLARRRGEPGPLPPEILNNLLTQRLDLQRGHVAFRDLVERHDLELVAEAIHIHAHWITPEFIPRRFDTLFFCARMPEGQKAQADGEEMTDQIWMRPEDALRERESGTRRIMFPTACNLDTIAGFADVDLALESSRARSVIPVLPRLETLNGVKKLMISKESGYRSLEDRSFPATGSTSGSKTR